jgi:hypothetical protein
VECDCCPQESGRCLGDLLTQLDWDGENVTESTFGSDDLRLARIDFQFSSQPRDLHVDGTIDNVFMDSRRLEEMLPRKQPLWRLQKGHQ